MPSPADAAVSSPDPVDEHRAASDVDLPRVTSVSVKLATFWPSNPKAWFAQSEAQFVVRGITQSLTKFYHCVAVLTEDVSAQLLDLISCPPSVEPFETLKTRLCDTFGLTPYQRFKAFLSLPFSSDMKPSHQDARTPANRGVSWVSVSGTLPPSSTVRHPCPSTPARGFLMPGTCPPS